jgi:hypothetical protein
MCNLHMPTALLSSVSALTVQSDSHQAADALTLPEACALLLMCFEV